MFVLQKEEERYLIFCLIGRHVVSIRAELREQSLLYESNVLSISGVVPVVDQASPDSARFPPQVVFWEEARDLARV